MVLQGLAARMRFLRLSTLGIYRSLNYNQFNQQALERIFAFEYQNPIALTTQFENTHSRWRRSQLHFRLNYLYLVKQRFGIGVEASLVGIFARTPEYVIDRGNYIPLGYAHFFPAQRLSSESANIAYTGTLSMRYMITRGFGVMANVEGLYGRINYKSEVYDTALTNTNSFQVQRRIEELRLPISTVALRVGIVLALGYRRIGGWD
jgi:hypothetical protein